MPEIESTNWQIELVQPAPVGRRSVAAVTADDHLTQVAGKGFEVTHTFQATSPQRRGTAPLPPLDVTVPADPNGIYVLAVRHADSDALTFHFPKAPAARRGVGPATATVTFEVSFPDAPAPIATTRGFDLSNLNPVKAVKGVVLKAVGELADLTVPWIGSKVEAMIWKNLRQGWLQVTPEALASGDLQPADFSKVGDGSQPCLLLIHGTFSNTAGGFGELASTKTAGGQDFFSALRPIYGDRIYAFNHFTVSKTPQQNAQELVDQLNLPAGTAQATFDVITHSRGGLVLRNLAERAGELGPNAGRFRLRRAALVASPNQGTPLATADRWEHLINILNNIVELFPPNQFSTVVEYIGAVLNFLARHVVDSLPGLESMDDDGNQIKTLQKAPDPPAGAYSALVSNYQPKGQLLKRLLDLGIDGIFGMANDLVVPTEGAWKTDLRPTWVAGAQIGCFGNNVISASDADVIHTTYFKQPEAVDFLIKTLTQQALGIAALDPDIDLPFGLRRGLPAMGLTAGVLAAGAATSGAALPAPAPPPAAAQSSAFDEFLPAQVGEADDVLHLFLISTDEHLPDDVPKPVYQTAILLGTFRNARAVETIFLRGAHKAPVGNGEDPPQDLHWNKIIAANEHIKDYVNGKPKVQLPDEDQMHALGVDLFNAMFPTGVRRLYDLARAEKSQAGQRLDVVLTSMINWVADKPWEFAYDPNRQSFLATEDVNFTRNVLTAIPAEEPRKRKGPLHILVVVAQPIGMGLLTAPEEEQVVRRGFQRLEESGLVTVEYMMNARIDLLHDRLREPDVDILHFIGHGEYDVKEKEGYLVFEDANGGMQLVSAESLRQVLCHRGIRLMFLNACETGMVGRSENPFDFNRGVAPKLVAGGIPVLVANQYKVLDVAATEFTRHFYRWLALGSTVGDAAREARVAVNYSIAGENIDWAVPVVYARNPCSTLYTAGETERAAAALRKAPQQERLRPCAGFKKTKIGLWDVNHVLPGLDEFAAKLSGVQSEYCFQTVEVSAPLGTWRGASQGGAAPKGYIDGAEVASKLHDHVPSLGVNKLICITVFALEDQTTQNLALWNQDGDDQVVSIISGSMVFEQAGQDRDMLHRFLANMVVSALGGKDGHTDPPSTCPNHYSDVVETDPKARAAYLTAKESFCENCSKKLGDAVGPLQKLLTAY
ncbi:MAG TPA: CHAT domain-containing protein [Bryobacteraceae bacterium]|jgi:hypothetical protein